MKPEKSIGRLWESASLRHDALAKLGSDSINRLSKEAEIAERRARTAEYIIVTFLALLSLIILPTAAAHGGRLASDWHAKIVHSQFPLTFFTKHVEIQITALLVGGGVFVYLFLFPSRLGKPLVPKELFDIDRRRVGFIIYGAALIYFVLLVGSILLDQSHIPVIDRPLSWLSVSLLFIPPALVFGLTPCAILLVLFAVTFHRRSSPYGYAPQAIIVRNLFQLLQQIEDIKNISSLSERVRGDIMGLIGHIGFEIEHMFTQIRSENPSARWAERQMRIAALNFLTIRSRFAFPRADTIDDVKSTIVNYISIFVTGEYESLARKELTEPDGILTKPPRARGLRRVLHFVWLFIYIVTPLLVYALVTTVYGIQLPAPAQSFLGILYSAWVGLGLFLFIDRVAPDAKGLLGDVMAMLLRK
jgi:hypothetical protein